MRSISFLTLYIWFLISFDVGVTASEKGENEEKWKFTDKKDEVKPPRPSFPLFTLPSFSQLSLPTFKFPQMPYLQGLSSMNRVRSPPIIRPTKTEYIEVTRRQTVHPICYTAYEAKSPCFTSEQGYRNDMDFESVHEAHENFDYDAARKLIQSTPTSPILSTAKPEENYKMLENDRFPKYLEFKAKETQRNVEETKTKIEGAEFFLPMQFSTNNEPTEYFTKTVLITKLEKYTDRRTTATLLAMNCLPVDRTIPICQTYPNPIRESPEGLHDHILRETNDEYDASAATSFAEEKAANEEINDPEISSLEDSTSEENEHEISVNEEQKKFEKAEMEDS